MARPIISYRSPDDSEQVSTWVWMRLGWISLFTWLTAISLFVGMAFYPWWWRNPNGPSLLRQHVDCLVPAGFAVAGLLIAAIGVVKDKWRGLAIAGIVLNLVAVFVLFSFDFLVGLQGG
jgi:hypothetical protein